MTPQRTSPARLARLAWERYLRWPVPLWRVAGYGTFRLGGHDLRFYGVADKRHVWWAQRARRGEWEPDVLDFFAETVQAGDVVLDIGAYIGPYTLLASRLVGPEGHVYAFEPDPVARGFLERNVAAGSAGNVTVVPCAVTDRAGSVFLQSSQLGNATTSISTTGGIAEAQAVTLRSFCEEHHLRPDVIKIDVEGWEHRVLAEDARPVVEGTRATIVEVHEWQMGTAGGDPGALRERLSAWNREVINVDRRGDLEGRRYESNYTVALV